MALTALERWDDVLAEMRVALEIDGTSPLAWLLRGEALVGKGDYAQAEHTLKRAKELDPSNAKVDQLLSEIEIARAAGLDGSLMEQTDTRVYPAKKSDPETEEETSDEKLASMVAPLAAAGGVVTETTGETTLEYDDEEATMVDPDPSEKVRELQALGGKDLADSDDPSTQTFLPSVAGHETSYEGPASDDYAERPRPRAPSLGEDSGPKATPLEAHRPVKLPKLTPLESSPPAAGTDPGIELSSADIHVVPAPTAPAEGRMKRSADHGIELAPRIDEDDEDEDEDTRQRHKRQVDEDAGTRPETPDLRRARQRRDSAPPEETAERAPWHQATPLPPPPTRPQKKIRNPFHDPPAPAPTPAPPAAKSLAPLARGGGFFDLERLRAGSVGYLVAALVSVVAAGVVAGLLVREWRMRARVAKRHELARQKVASGNYPGFQAAELLYRQILTERDDPPARALRARTLAQMSFEFGDSPDAAARAVAGLGEMKGEDAESARIYLAMAKGEADAALRQSAALRRQLADAPATYLYGRAELLLDRPQAAVDALRSVADLEPRDPIAQHALGVAEAALKHDDRALEAYKHALEANANHIATIIDRALLQVRRGSAADRDLARGALEGVVSKLVPDCSQGQLARAYLGLAELELGRGDLEAARRALSLASARRRDGDTLLSEELARAWARGFQLDEAEREAKRALAGSTRIGPRLVLAEVALRRARPAQALAVIDEQGATRPEALVLRALAHLAMGRKDAARLDAEAALRVAPELASAKVALARVTVAEGRPERAQRDLERLERGDKLPEVASALGEVFAAERQTDKARWWLREAIRRDPLLLDARLQLATMLHGAGRYDEADAELKQLLRLDGNYRAARFERARLDLDRGQAQAARDELDALAGSEPDAETWMAAARAHLVLGDAAGAIDRVTKATKLAPELADDAVEILARAYLAEHRPADVVALYRKGSPAALKPPMPALLMNAYLDLDQPERAAEVLSLTQPRARLGTDALVARARLAIERGRDATAQSVAQQALVKLRGPTAPPLLKSQALTVLGRAEWEQGDFRSAARVLQEAVQLDPRNARAWYFLGMADEDLRRHDDARKAMETAVELDPKYPEAQFYLGRARADAGDARSADNFRAYLDLAPKGVYVEDARRALEPAPTPTSAPPRKKRRAR
jgi:tetratricopeptide (TPR) repeat protein